MAYLFSDPKAPGNGSRPEVIVFYENLCACHGYASAVLNGLPGCSEEKDELPENYYRAFRMRLDGMRSLGGISGRRTSHSAVNGESALAFLRRWIWVSIRRGRASGADAPSGRGGRCSPILCRLREGGKS
jgi:hypothetical protein